MADTADNKFADKKEEAVLLKNEGNKFFKGDHSLDWRCCIASFHTFDLTSWLFWLNPVPSPLQIFQSTSMKKQ